jgi:hypothetical protein
MTFAEKMAVWTLVLEYLKVVLGYPVTIPVLVGFLCWLFRERIGAALDAIQELSFKGASVRLKERAQLIPYNATVEQTAEATAQEATHAFAPARVQAIQGLVSFFILAARTLPLIPKAERQRFIAESTKGLPEEFKTFRTALEKLADEAPEVHALSARDVIITPETGTLWSRGGNAELRHGRKDDVPPAPKG